MNKKLSIIAMLVFFSIATSAQFINNSKPVVAEEAAKQLPAQLFTQFFNSIKPISFISSSSKQKKSLLANVTKAKDGESLFKNISTLVTLIKPEMFVKNFSASEFLKPSLPVKNLPAAMAILRDLEQSLKPEAITDFWKLQKAGWLVNLNKVK
jgi:hypothetical protein